MVPISIQHVVKAFGKVRALDDVSVEIDRGELFFLLGPSGCGKTTLLRTIAGFYMPDAGRVCFGERDLTHVPPEARNTGMVFQNYALWPHMTVEANVEFGLRVRRVPRAERRRRVAEALDMVKMGQYARRKPNQLSGGQQQRIALARALVIRPQCLLLDEPLSNLDAKLRLDMRTEIRRLCKAADLTAVYVTHDQKEALSIADRMAVMFAGQIVQAGTPQALYRRPATPAVADFLGETNFVPGEIVEVSGETRAVRTALGILRAHGDAGGPRQGPCTLSVRPEAIVVGIDDATENRFAARVVQATYLGESVQVTLDASGTTLRATVPERAGGAGLADNGTVRCGIDPRDVVVLNA